MFLRASALTSDFRAAPRQRFLLPPRQFARIKLLHQKLPDQSPPVRSQPPTESQNSFSLVVGPRQKQVATFPQPISSKQSQPPPATIYSVVLNLPTTRFVKDSILHRESAWVVLRVHRRKSLCPPKVQIRFPLLDGNAWLKCPSRTRTLERPSHQPLPEAARASVYRNPHVRVRPSRPRRHDSDPASWPSHSKQRSCFTIPGSAPNDFTQVL